MPHSKVTRVISSAISILLVLEGCYFLWLGYAFARVFRGAQNVSASDPLPSAVWTNVATAVVLIILAGAYAANIGNLKRWFAAPALLALLYGVWAIWSGYPIMTSFESAFDGDVVSLDVVSGVGFVALGILGLLAAGRKGKRSAAET